MSVKEKMTAIADNIRSKTESSEKLTLNDIPDAINNVYEKGKNAKIKEFWEKFQSGGTRVNWQYAFYGAWWRDDMFHPVYPFKVGNTNTNMFYNCNVTNTKVMIDISDSKLNYTFRESGLVTIPELKVTVETDINNAFTSTSRLENITIVGTLGKSVKINACPLTAESIKSIIMAICDCSGTENEYAYTLTFKASSFAKLEADGTTSPNGNTWAEYVDDLKWNLTLA